MDKFFTDSLHIILVDELRYVLSLQLVSFPAKKNGCCSVGRLDGSFLTQPKHCVFVGIHNSCLMLLCLFDLFEGLFLARQISKEATELPLFSLSNIHLSKTKLDWELSPILPPSLKLALLAHHAFLASTQVALDVLVVITGMASSDNRVDILANQLLKTPSKLLRCSSVHHLYYPPGIDIKHSIKRGLDYSRRETQVPCNIGLVLFLTGQIFDEATELALLSNISGYLDKAQLNWEFTAVFPFGHQLPLFTHSPLLSSS
mmetsp:Transcript_28670/g.84499  ORF Transcript_28670/g.84499 Transcript_28670/m.84499 type:complete len:259 (-) Transcript_28670:1034-1810(-)